MAIFPYRTRKTRRAQPEAELQRSTMNLLRAILPPDTVFTHFPLGGGGKEHGARMLAFGACAGFPDILIFHEGRAFCIELKSAVGTLSPTQRATHEALRRAGVRVEVARTIAEVLDHLRSFGVKTRIKDPSIRDAMEMQP